MFADVAEAHRPKQRIDHGVQDHIAIAVSDRAHLLGDDDSCQQKLAARLQAVQVITVTDANGVG